MQQFPQLKTAVQELLDMMETNTYTEALLPQRRRVADLLAVIGAPTSKPFEGCTFTSNQPTGIVVREGNAFHTPTIVTLDSIREELSTFFSDEDESVDGADFVEYGGRLYLDLCQQLDGEMRSAESFPEL